MDSYRTYVISYNSIVSHIILYCPMKSCRAPMNHIRSQNPTESHSTLHYTIGSRGILGYPMESTVESCGVIWNLVAHLYSILSSHGILWDQMDSQYPCATCYYHMLSQGILIITMVSNGVLLHPYIIQYCSIPSHIIIWNPMESSEIL